MEWSEQFNIFEKIISQYLSERGTKYTMQNAANFLGIKLHKYQAWKNGQRPVVEDLRMLAQSLEFRPDWLLLGVGQPLEDRLDRPFKSEYVEICDTLHELVRALPDGMPQIASIGRMKTNELFDCIHTQAFPPSEAIREWILHYHINANFLLAQIGQPFLTEAQFLESGPLNFVRERRGDFDYPDDDDDDAETNSNNDADVDFLRDAEKQAKERAEIFSAMQSENEKLKQKLIISLDEITALNAERRKLTARLEQEQQTGFSQSMDTDLPALPGHVALGVQLDGIPE